MDALLKETVDAAINSRYPGMAPEGRRLIEEILIRKEVEKGALLLNEGQISHNIVFVGKGMLRQFYYKNGKDVTEHFSYEGCIIICIESTLKQEPTHLMIEALEPSVVYLLPYNKLLTLGGLRLHASAITSSWNISPKSSSGLLCRTLRPIC